MIKNLFYVFLVTSFFSQSCIKGPVCAYEDKNIASSAAEITYLENYFTANNITNITQHSSGVFYTISSAGNGNTPNLCSNVVVNYNAFLLGASAPFDGNNSVEGINFILGQLIVGVQKTLPLIKDGGTITLYIPPSLAYGSNAQQDQNGSVIVPANAYLKFVFTILGVV
jgi:FKBP-type peptidyl-prolyl cis-trans isomerase